MSREKFRPGCRTVSTTQLVVMLRVVCGVWCVVAYWMQPLWLPPSTLLVRFG